MFIILKVDRSLKQHRSFKMSQLTHTHSNTMHVCFNLGKDERNLTGGVVYSAAVQERLSMDAK